MPDHLANCATRRLARGALVCALVLLLAPVHAADDSASAVLHVRVIDTRSAVRSVRVIGGAQFDPSSQLSPAGKASMDVKSPNTVGIGVGGGASVLATTVPPTQSSRPPDPEATGHSSLGLTSLRGSGRQPAYRQPLLASVQQAGRPLPGAVLAQSDIGPDNDILLPRAWYDTTPGRIGIFIGASAVASLADRGVKDWALRHQHDAFNRDVIKVRDILPWPALWLAAATSFPSPWANDKLAHTSTVAFTSAVLTGAEALALKAVIGRDRPADSNSPYNFTAFNPRYNLIYGASSFPSGHTALTWALITPYARVYHMPWLYALGVASGAGRVMQNAHWFSDVVGGGLLGYFTARWTEEHMVSKANVQWVFTGNGLYLFKSF